MKIQMKIIGDSDDFCIDTHFILVGITYYSIDRTHDRLLKYNTLPFSHCLSPIVSRYWTFFFDKPNKKTKHNIRHTEHPELVRCEVTPFISCYIAKQFPRTKVKYNKFEKLLLKTPGVFPDIDKTFKHYLLTGKILPNINISD